MSSYGNLKCCTLCKKSKPLSEYGKNKQNKDGLESRCKLCKREIKKKGAGPKRNAQMKAWRVANKEHVKEQKAANYQENKESIKASVKSYRVENKEEISIRSKAKYRADNPNPNQRGPVPITEKICPSCGELKQRDQYYKKLTSISHQCKSCTDKVTTEHKNNNPEDHVVYQAKSLKVNAKKRKDKYKNDPEYREKISKEKTDRYAENGDAIRANQRERYANDPVYRAVCLAQNKRTKDRQPSWADLEAIREVYRTCPKGYHVDHEYPLKGKTVSGLHVAANLQHLSAKENLRKSNKF